MFYLTFLVINIFVLLSPFQFQSKKKERKMDIKITSDAFKDGEMIPSKFTCEGENISPQLKIEFIPEGTKSLALINDDPDAPMGDWVHWVMYNIPIEITNIRENVSLTKITSFGAVQGLNDFKKIGYGGPCPPSGVHRYFFKIYALDTKLKFEAGATKKQILDAMKGHILSIGKLMGKYKRIKK